MFDYGYKTMTKKLNNGFGVIEGAVIMTASFSFLRNIGSEKNMTDAKNPLTSLVGLI
jgi:hypothetical protein